jgi:HAD superfamily hydrolase (TIGR01549 family)
MLNHPIKTIIFDLDGTLRYNSPSADDVQYQLALDLGVSDEPGRQRKGTRWSHYYWAQSSELMGDQEKFGEMNEPFWINYCYRYILSLDVPDNIAADLSYDLCQLMDEKFKPDDKLFPQVPEILQFLKDSGYTLGLVSNRSQPCQDHCEELGLLDYFDFAYVAAEVNVWKPDPRIFDRAFEITGHPPEQTVYIGDNFYADIRGAQNASMQPILFDQYSVFPEADCTVIKSIQDLRSLFA